MIKTDISHYFVSIEHKESDFFFFDANFDGKNLKFKSCSNVFSKNELDYGSLVLVKTVLSHKDIFSGKIMDMCCGYGTIGILLSLFLDAEYYMADINSTAVNLAKENVKINNCNIDTCNIFESDMFDGINEMFDHIVSNPPIKAGKENLLKCVNGAFEHTRVGGTLTLVIKKNLGADSLKTYLTQLYGNCDVWKRDKGYYILHSKKF